MKLNIGKKKIGVECNGATPLIYRKLLKRDLFVDLSKVLTPNEIDDKYAIHTNEFVENLLYVMAYQKDEEIGTMKEFLSQFEVYDISNATEEILKPWLDNIETTEESKKK